MRLYRNETDLKKDSRLHYLLNQRKAPLSEEGMRLALTDLTLYLTNDIEFAGAVYLKNTEGDLTLADLDKADMMEGTDGERYLPVFTTVEELRKFKPELKNGESLCLFDKQDLLDFLNGNEKVAAVVVNPMNDDLLLYRVQLSNMISLAKQKTSDTAA